MGEHSEPPNDTEAVVIMGRPQISRTPQQAKDNTRLVWSALMMLLAFGVATAFNIWYTSHTQRQSDQKFCAVFVGLDDRYRIGIPKGAEDFARQIHDLRKSLHCPNTVVVIPPTPRPSQE